MKIDFNKIDETLIPAFKGGVHYCPKGHTHSLAGGRCRENREPADISPEFLIFVKV